MQRSIAEWLTASRGRALAGGLGLAVFGALLLPFSSWLPGALIVLGYDRTVETICTGGFVLDVEFSSTRLRELCKMDGAVVLSSDGTRRSFDVTIPAGVTDGQRIRLAGQGGRGSDGAPNGDLYLIVRIAPHPRYRLDGRDLYVELRLAP